MTKGFYWVSVDNYRFIAYWNGRAWKLADSCGDKTDKYCAELLKSGKEIKVMGDKL